MEGSKVNVILTFVILILLVVSVGYTFYKTILLGDFHIVESPIEEEIIEEDI